MSFSLRPKAVSDLEAIADAISSAHPRAADQSLDDIYRKLQLLGESPEMGPSRDDIRPGMRIVPAGNYLIFYRLIGRDAEVVRVLHGARDLKQIIGEL